MLQANKYYLDQEGFSPSSSIFFQKQKSTPKTILAELRGQTWGIWWQPLCRHLIQPRRAASLYCSSMISMYLHFIYCFQAIDYIFLNHLAVKPFKVWQTNRRENMVFDFVDA